MRGNIIALVIFSLHLTSTRGIEEKLNSMKINLTEFTEAMQLCDSMLGFDKDDQAKSSGSQEDLNRTLCLSFCALQKLNTLLKMKSIRNWPKSSRWSI